jgi:hypothetical protein
MRSLHNRLWDDNLLMDADNFFLVYMLQMPKDGRGYSGLFPFTLEGSSINYRQWVWEGFE